MKRLTIFSIILTACLFTEWILPVSANAQSFDTPEQVETLLDEIQDCKENIAELTNVLAKMEANPDKYTIADYRYAKTFLKENQDCLQYNRKELDRLRKLYPQWFNLPSAVAEPDSRTGRLINEQHVNRILDEMEKDLDECDQVVISLRVHF